ncbi:hypothetical protein KKB55_23160 [Myxococcota bacterium]|nr:hypothetical protein [Myxococcota bacterium]MBU1900656.1 hypothetical protein [Myxococcota bacterium]
MAVTTSVNAHRAGLALLLALSSLAPFGAEAAGAGGLSPSDAPGCTLCHMVWMPVWRQPEVYTLLPKPEAAVVSLEPTCFGCHDGAISDSRIKVWNRKGHESGLPIPRHMSVPTTYPLVNGALACRTCHTAHSVPEAMSANDAVSVRGVVKDSVFCLNCHSTRTVDTKRGAHFVGDMPFPVPKALRDQGARAGEGDHHLHCQVCHMPHGTTHEHQLVMSADEDGLCLNCHQDQRSGRWHPPPKGEHRPRLNAEGLRATRYLGTRAGPEGQLLCLSCHRMHAHDDQAPTQFALVRPLADPAMCVSCHLDKQPLLISPHDLRRSAPEYKNKHGQTPAEAGPCGSCHLFHDRAIEDKGDRADPAGLCNPCHKGDGVGVEAGPVIHGHPVQVRMRGKITGLSLPLGPGKRITCTTCHDPHAAPGDNFLRAPTSRLCVSCHPKQDKALNLKR